MGRIMYRLKGMENRKIIVINSRRRAIGVLQSKTRHANSMIMTSAILRTNFMDRLYLSLLRIRPHAHFYYSYRNFYGVRPFTPDMSGWIQYSPEPTGVSQEIPHTDSF